MTRRTTQGIALLMLGAALVLGAGVRAIGSDTGQTPIGPARPTQAVDPSGCVTAECHPAVKGYPVSHAPVFANTCDACHLLTNAETHTFELARQKAEMCTFCHQFDTGMLPVVHMPVIAGECLGCHNPHGGTDQSLVREPTMAQTCGRCHESVVLGLRFLHHPTETGECNSCHRPHASKYPKLLDAVGTDLCLSCHQDFKEQMDKAAFTHKMSEEGCASCHEAHGSAYPMQVNQSLSDLCLSCHEDIRESAEAMVKHPAVQGERACLTCHTAHGGNLAHLMRDQTIQVCMGCHDRKIEDEGIELLTAMVRINDPTRFKHTPVREGQCGGCHIIHGGDKPLLLRHDYSPRFHQRFAAGEYDLCFDCHDPRLVKNKQANELTNFRNGNRNLHFVHVAGGRDSDRNCRVCHGVHTSKNPSLVRDRVPFGNWLMTIRFEQTPTGGTCMTGCHPQYSYDREKPVKPASTASAPRSSPRVPAADKRQPLLAKWSGRDIRGAEVRVPADGRPSVLLFLRNDQAQNRRATQMISAATARTGPAQVVVVFSGEKASEQAQAFAAKQMGNWPVVADPEYALAGRFGVKAWPATLVARADGAIAAHLGGAAPSLAMELEAYIELAADKINREGVARRLTELGLVSDGPAHRAEWHLQMGRKMLDEGQAEEARNLFADGLKAEPDSVELKIGLIRGLLELKNGAQAIALLEQLPAGALPDWERNLLRGRGLAILGQWDDARRLAEAALQEKPDLAEAHRLMGMVYENDRDWEKAAEHYRAMYMKGGR